MKQFSKDLGNVSLAPKGKWSREQEYEKLALVYNVCDNLSYVSKINVPRGVDIENREYWQPMNATGYADNNFINLTAENENGTITAYETLEEAVATILPINRKAGATLSFFNLNADRLDRQAEFELWQFNSTDLANWENRDYWNNIYYNWNVFVGWYIGADALKNHVKIPNVGQYAYVGSNLNDAILYQCRTNGTWTNTGIKVRNYMSVVVSGNITIGENGNWFSDGKDTGIPATPAVDEQFDNIIMQLQQHAIEINNLKAADTNLQDQITSNNSDITNLTAKHESLSRTVQGISATGGASTANNVTYNNDSSGLNAENAQDAIDELQGSKIDKTSILQELGNSEDKVISQKAVSDKFSDLSNDTIKLSISIKKIDTGNNLLDVSKIVEGAGIWAGINSDCFFGNSNKNFKLSPFIRVHKEGLCTVNTARTQSGLSSYIVFDENLKSVGRNGQNTDIYTYQEGDAYIRFCWNVVDASNICVCIGTDYKYEKYTDTYKTDVEIKNLSTALANTLKKGAIQDESIKSSNFDMIESFLVDARFLLNESVNFGVTSGNLKFGESSSLTIFKVDNDGNYDMSSRFEVTFEYSKPGLYRLRGTTNYYLNKPISYDIVLLLDGHDYSFSANKSKLNKFVYEEHEGYIKEQEEKRYSLEDIKNGKKISLRNSYDNLGANIEYLSEKAFTITTHEIGNRWSCLNVPIIGAGKYIYIEADIYKYEKNGSLLDSTDINLWVTNGTKEYSPDNCVQVLTHIQSGSHVKYVLDPSYYSIYKGWNTFNVWIETSFKNEELLKVLNFEIYSFDEEKKFANISGENALEIFSSVDEKLKSVSSNKDNQYLVSPNGKKFELSIGDNGTLKTISTIPSKGIFIGNSLLKGFNPLNQNVFGMAATNIADDYYHIIDAYIKNNLNSGYTAKISASFTKDVDKLEQITDASKIEEYVNDLMEHIDGAEDLVCIQLGDNIQNINLFKSWGNLLLSSIRKKCINARVAWIGVWYGDDTKYEILKAICVNNGVHFISFAGIPSSATKNKIGGVFYSPTHGPIENVTSVNKISDNDDGSYKAEVIFSVNGNSYTATIPDMKSYDLGEDGVLGYDSKYDVIKNAGVASHPNNEGHKLIASRFISEMF